VIEQSSVNFVSTGKKNYQPKKINLMKFSSLIIIAGILLACNFPGSQPPQTIDMNSSLADSAKSIHDFKVLSLMGDTIDFNQFKGKKILIVNTASACGYTPQYEDLEKLYNQYKNKLVVIGFPANNFGAQEPGSNADIGAFCKKNYGVTFPMAAKVSVKGNDITPIYEWLTQKSKNGVLDTDITWNFNKFLLDEQGRIVAKFDSNTLPLSNDIVGKL
jgi:glutathione peroxidase